MAYMNTSRLMSGDVTPPILLHSVRSEQLSPQISLRFANTPTGRIHSQWETNNESFVLTPRIKVP